MKKFWITIFSTIFAIVLTLCMSVSLVGCKKTGPIPDGNYFWRNQNFDVFIFTENSIRTSYGWVIDGDTAEEWVSSYCNYKAKIVEKDGKLYFEGYTWKEPRLGSCDTIEFGNDTKYEAVYDETTKSITLTRI